MVAIVAKAKRVAQEEEVMTASLSNFCYSSNFCLLTILMYLKEEVEVGKELAAIFNLVTKLMFQ